MSAVALPPPRCVSDEVEVLAAAIARAVTAAVPKGFRGKLTITVDDGRALPHNVAIELRPPQPKESGRG